MIDSCRTAHTWTINIEGDMGFITKSKYMILFSCCLWKTNVYMINDTVYIVSM